MYNATFALPLSVEAELIADDVSNDWVDYVRHPLMTVVKKTTSTVNHTKQQLIVIAIMITKQHCSQQRTHPATCTISERQWWHVKQEGTYFTDIELQTACEVLHVDNTPFNDKSRWLCIECTCSDTNGSIAKLYIVWHSAGQRFYSTDLTVQVTNLQPFDSIDEQSEVETPLWDTAEGGGWR